MVKKLQGQSQHEKVLHITEAFGGGVQTALYSYVHSSHELRARHNDLTKDSNHDVLLKRNGWWWASVRDANQTINDIKPNIVHLHSSKAGF